MPDHHTMCPKCGARMWVTDQHRNGLPVRCGCGNEYGLDEGATAVFKAAADRKKLLEEG
jgi:hypothetical protein